MDTVLAGTQTGNAEDYAVLREICDPGTVIVDDSNPLELAKFVIEKDVDLFIGGVKERPSPTSSAWPSATQHEARSALRLRRHLNFGRKSRNRLSPIWKLVPRRSGMGANITRAPLPIITKAAPIMLGAKPLKAEATFSSLSLGLENLPKSQTPNTQPTTRQSDEDAASTLRGTAAEGGLDA
jgi:hypothetical protein